MVYTYQDYKGRVNEITIEECMELHQMIKSEIRDDEEAEEIYADLLEKALDYIPYRVRWTYKDREWRNRYDESRTMCHDSMITHFNMLARYLRQQGRSAEWRDKLGDDRRRIGDFAGYLVYVQSIGGR